MIEDRDRNAEADPEALPDALDDILSRMLDEIGKEDVPERLRDLGLQLQEALAARGLAKGPPPGDGAGGM